MYVAASSKLIAIRLKTDDFLDTHAFNYISVNCALDRCLPHPPCDNTPTISKHYWGETRRVGLDR